jgi:hypothetical protein
VSVPTDAGAFPGEAIISAAVRRGLCRRTRSVLAIEGSPLPGTELDVELRLALPPAGQMLRIAIVDCLVAGHEWDGLTRAVASILTAPTCTLPGTRLTVRFDCADDTVRAAITDGAGPGWRAAVVGIDGDRLMVANLGDVRVYRLVDDYLGCLTPVPDPPSVTRTQEKGLREHCVRLLGTTPPVILDVAESAVPLRPGDRVLFATNGVHATLRLGEGRLVTPSFRLPNTLVEAAIDQGAREDAAALVVEIR